MNLCHDLTAIRTHKGWHVFLPRCCDDNQWFPQRVHETQLLRSQGKVSCRVVCRLVTPDALEIPRHEQTACRKGLRCSADVHAAFGEVNKLKKRQKGGGWSLINRRSHILYPRLVLCMWCLRVDDFTCIGCVLVSGCQLPADATSNKIKILHNGDSFLTDFLVFPEVLVHTPQGIPGGYICKTYCDIIAEGCRWVCTALQEQ